MLDALARKNKQKLNWRKSIVDLMKLLDLDSSQTARKKLAEELHYTGDTKNSAKMNVWLHKQVMIKLAANGGKVPLPDGERRIGFGSSLRPSSSGGARRRWIDRAWMQEGHGDIGADERAGGGEQHIDPMWV